MKDDPQSDPIRRCAVCQVTQSEYAARTKGGWLMGHLAHWYCEAHNPQLQHSLREMVRFERESIERRAMRKAA